MAEPLLHLGDVGMMVERVGGGGGTQGMRADFKPQLRRIGPHHSVDAIGGDRLFELAGAVVPDRPEQRAVVVGAVSGRIEVVIDEAVGAGMQREIPRLAALADPARLCARAGSP